MQELHRGSWGCLARLICTWWHHGGKAGYTISLDFFAGGVPLVTTRVGQAMDLVRHGENAWMTDVEDFENLAALALQVYGLGADSLQPILKNARATAEANSYDSQTQFVGRVYERL